MTVEFILGVLACLIVASSGSHLSLTHPPQWLFTRNVDMDTWKRLCIGAGIGSFLISASIGSFWWSTGTVGSLAGMVSVAGLVFVFIQSAYTDFRFRLVDRWMLRLMMAFSAMSGVTYLVSFAGEVEILMYLVVNVVMLTLFFVKGIGSSDVRALVMVSASVVTLLGYEKFMVCLIAMFALVLGLVVVESVRKGELKRIFTAKHSLPMVPFITFPPIVVIALTPVW